MHVFDATERRIDNTCRRFPSFPREPAVLVRLVKHVARSVHDAANERLREYGINHTDYNILMMLYGSRDATISPSRLAEAAGEKVANITRVCNALCDKKLIHRAPSGADRRKVELRLSTRGTALIEQLLPEMVRLLQVSVTGLDTDEQVTLERLLKKMLSHTERMREAT